MKLTSSGAIRLRDIVWRARLVTVGSAASRTRANPRQCQGACPGCTARRRAMGTGGAGRLGRRDVHGLVVAAAAGRDPGPEPGVFRAGDGHRHRLAGDAAGGSGQPVRVPAGRRDRGVRAAGGRVRVAPRGLPPGVPRRCGRPAPGVRVLHLRRCLGRAGRPAGRRRPHRGGGRTAGRGRGGLAAAQLQRAAAVGGQAQPGARPGRGERHLVHLGGRHPVDRGRFRLAAQAAAGGPGRARHLLLGGGRRALPGHRRDGGDRVDGRTRCSRPS